MCLQNAIGNSNNCSMRQLQSRLQRKTNDNKPIQAIELGSGCGVVGIALAQMLPRCSVTLTDLPEVQDIMARNLQHARSAPGSTCDFRELDWDEELDGDSMPVDLILVSDCTYNADSLPSLVQVLSRLVHASPQAVVLVSLKRRHESEAVFFELMRRSAFAVLEESSCALPAAYAEEDRVEMYTFIHEQKE
jgi:predicted nicotinamide N-methyase